MNGNFPLGSNGSLEQERLFDSTSRKEVRGKSGDFDKYIERNYTS